MRPLGPTQARFVREWMNSRNGEQAAIAVGYSKKNARSQAARLLTKANVKAEIARQLSAISDRTLITVDRLIQEISYLAFAGGDRPIPISQLPLHVRKAIASVKVKRQVERGEDGFHAVEIIEYKLWDKGQAQERLAKHLGIFMEQDDIQVIRDRLTELLAKIQASQVQP